jgi:hypothetical protein
MSVGKLRRVGRSVAGSRAKELIAALEPFTWASQEVRKHLHLGLLCTSRELGCSQTLLVGKFV